MSALLLTLFLGLFNPSLDSIPSDSTELNVKKGAPLYIDAIFIIGNKKTKEDIILRELGVQKGQTIYSSDLASILELDKSKLLNTRLFNTVEISTLYLNEYTVDIVVNVSERWYTFPVPIFDLVDRNFNDWWQNQNRDISRTNIGVNIYKNNFRGRNETLRLLLQLGYTKQYGISYQIPYLDKKKNHGLYLNYKYSENKNIALRTELNKPVFFDSEEILRTEKEYTVGYRYRRSFYGHHSLNFTFNDNEVNDTIASMNPEYFGEGRKIQRYADIEYSFAFDRRDFGSYPLKGYRIEFRARKQGLGIYNDVNRFDIKAGYTFYKDLGRGIYYSNYTSAYVSSPELQSYINYTGLGFKKDFVRGYELYLIEGKSYYLNRATIKKRLFSTVWDFNAMPVEQFRKLPLSIFFKLYFDMGYSENFENYSINSRLADRYIFGSGAGFDIVSYYDTVIRLEYSVNREKESGFFLHLKKEF